MKIISININIYSYIDKYKLYNDIKPNKIENSTLNFDEILKTTIEQKKVR